MKSITIQYKGQSLTLSSDDITALESALNQARHSNKDIQQMTNNGVMLVSSKEVNGQHFSKAIRPSDCILTPPAQPMYSANEMILADC